MKANKNNYAELKKYFDQYPKLKLTEEEELFIKANCSLLPADQASYKGAMATLGNLAPEQLKNWLKLFNGGILLDTTFLSEQEISVVNSDKNKADEFIDENAMIFAKTHDGDYFCFDADENDGAIYQWGTQDRIALEKWDDFNTWLKDEVLKQGIIFIKKHQKNN